MNTNSTSAVSGYVLVFSRAFLNGKPITKPLLCTDGKRTVARPEIHTSILVADAAGAVLGELPNGEDISFGLEALLAMQEDPTEPEHDTVLRAKCWSTSGRYVHSTITYGPLMIPVAWGKAGGEPMFRKTHGYTMGQAIKFIGGSEAMPSVDDMVNSGWVLTRADGDPIIALPYCYPVAAAAEAVMQVAAYKEAIAEAGQVYLARQAPMDDPYGDFVAYIKVVGDQTAQDALNAHVGIVPPKAEPTGHKDPHSLTGAEGDRQKYVGEPADSEL